MIFTGVMKKKKAEFDKLFEYRIKYNATEEHVALDNYHYFMATSAEEALKSHHSMLNKHNLKVQDISIEKFNPYSNKWEEDNVN